MRKRLEYLAKQGDPEAIKALARLDLRKSTGFVRRAEHPALFYGRGDGGGFSWGGHCGGGSGAGEEAEYDGCGWGGGSCEEAGEGSLSFIGDGVGYGEGYGTGCGYNGWILSDLLGGDGRSTGLYYTIPSMEFDFTF